MNIVQVSSHSVTSIHHKTGIKHNGQHNKMTDVFRKIISKMEKTSPHNISVMKIARNNNISHRRVYDFFNMLTTLGVCKVIKKGQLAWISLKEVHKVLARNYEKLEMLAISSTFEDIFILEPSPSLGSIALKFIGLFLYLNVDTLSVKQVAKVFHDGKTDIKSLERRLYMVLNFLEVIDIVKHSDRVGQYKLIINRESILNPAWAMRQISQTNTIGFTIESLLSRPNLFHIRIIYENRRELFKRSYSLK